MAYFRGLNLGLAWSVHGDINGTESIQTASGGEVSHPINSLKNEQRRGHIWLLYKNLSTFHLMIKLKNCPT